MHVFKITPEEYMEMAEEYMKTVEHYQYSKWTRIEGDGVSVTGRFKRPPRQMTYHIPFWMLRKMMRERDEKMREIESGR